MGDKTAVREAEPERRRLYRNRKDRKIAGVLGGLGDYFGVDPTFIRVLYVVATILTGFIPLTFLYFVMMFLIPAAPKQRPVGE